MSSDAPTASLLQLAVRLDREGSRWARIALAHTATWWGLQWASWGGGLAGISIGIVLAASPDSAADTTKALLIAFVPLLTAATAQALGSFRVAERCTIWQRGAVDLCNLAEQARTEAAGPYGVEAAHALAVKIDLAASELRTRQRSMLDELYDPAFVARFIPAATKPD